MTASHTIDFIDKHSSKVRIISAGLFASAGIFLLALLLSTININTATDRTHAETTPTIIASDDPNAVAGGLNTAGATFKQAVAKTGQTINNSLRSVEIGAVQSSKVVVKGGVASAHGVRRGTLFVATSIGHGAAFVGRSAGHGAAMIIRLPGNVLRSVSRTTAVSAVIQPADSTPVPVIDPKVSAQLAASDEKIPKQPIGQTAPAPMPALFNTTASSGGAWPIRGAITTAFGVPEPPYQPIHTGIDISDGQRPGVTPIHAFRPGKVVQVIHSSQGLGNHVIIDHGNGLTSVYGHLYSTAVEVGQQVDMQTTVGLEGSTGVSTGCHLHFEVRLNGQAVDPHDYINGQPF